MPKQLTKPISAYPKIGATDKHDRLRLALEDVKFYSQHSVAPPAAAFRAALAKADRLKAEGLIPVFLYGKGITVEGASDNPAPDTGTRTRPRGKKS